MSSLLQPIGIDTCQTTLRGRRRSSIRTLNPIPALFSAISSASHGSALCDEPDAPGVISSRSQPVHNAAFVALSPLSSVHMSGHSTNIQITRHHDIPLSTIHDASPSSSLPSSAFNSRKPSLLELADNQVLTPYPQVEHMKLRIVSAFFVYFLCGWGDGGLACNLFFALYLTLHISYSDGDRATLYEYSEL